MILLAVTGKQKSNLSCKFKLDLLLDISYLFKLEAITTHHI